MTTGAFTFHRTTGDFTAATSGYQVTPGQLSVGDVAGVSITDPDVSLQGVTIHYEWWVNGAAIGTAPTLAITTGMAGQHVQLALSFSHQDFSGTHPFNELDKGVFDFGNVGALASTPTTNYLPATLAYDTAYVHDLQDSTAIATSNLSGNVLANDISTAPLHVSAIDGNALTTNGHTTIGGAYGTLTMYGDGHYSFNVDHAAVEALGQGFSTQLDYQVHVTDGHGGGGIEDLYIQVVGANDAPTATFSSNLHVTAATGGNSLVGHVGMHDVDGDVPVVVAVSDSSSMVGNTFHGRYGDLHMTANGDFTYAANLSNSVVAGLAPGQTVVEHISFAISDGYEWVTNTLDITVQGAFVSPTLVADHASIADLTSPSSFATSNLAGNLLANDSSTSPLEVKAVYYGDASHLLSGTQTTIGGSYGTLIMHSNGDYSFDYNPTAINALGAGFHTTLDFAVSVTNGFDGGQIEHLTIQVDGANDAPIDVSATLSGSVGSRTVEGYQQASTSGWLGSPTGFVDPEGSALHFSLSGEQMSTKGHQSGSYTYITEHDAYGTFWLWNTGGWSFTLNADAAAYVALGSSDTTALHYQVGVSDGAGGTSLADVVVTIHGQNDAPVASNDTIVAPSVSGAFHLTGNLLANDHDPDANDQLSVVGVHPVITGPTTFLVPEGSVTSSAVATLHNNYGTLTVWGGGTYSLDIDPHGADFNALALGQTDTLHFSYTVSDGHSGTSIADITLVIAGVNDAPTIHGEIIGTTLVEDSITGASGSYYFSDVDNGDHPTVHAVNGVTSATVSTTIELGTREWFNVAGLYGTLHISADGYFEYDLNANAQALAQGETQVDDFTFTVSDGHGGTASTSLSFQVNGAEDAPVASDFTFSLVASGSASTNLLAHVVDVDHSANLEITSFADTSSAVGTWVDTAYGSYHVDASGTLEFRVDAAAVAFLGVGEQTTLSFSYGAMDSWSAHDTGHVSIVISGVNDLAVVSNDAASLSEDAAGVSGNVLANDVDPDLHDVLIVADITATDGKLHLQGDYGFVTIASSGHYQYHLTAPSVNGLAAGSSVQDCFRFAVTDQHGGTVFESLTITVTGQNDAPVASSLMLTGHDSGTVSGLYHSGTSLSVDLLGAVVDPDAGDTVAVAGIATSTDGVFGASISTSLGSATVDGSGILHFHIDQAAVDHLAAGSTDQVTIAYRVADLSGSTDISTVTVTIVGGNDAPTAQDGSIGIVAGATLAAHGTLAFGDVDNFDAAAVASVSALSFGSGSWLTITTSYGDLHVSRSGAYSFTVDNASTAVQRIAAGQVHDEHFTYHVADLGGLTASATIDVAITGINEAPVATAHYAAATESGIATPGSDATGNLLVGASDIDGDAMHVVGFFTGDSYANTVSLTYGTASVTANGAFDFHVNEAAADYLPAGGHVDVTIDFKIADSHGGTGIESLYITVYGANDAPVAASVSASMTEDTPTLAGFLLTNATDPDTGDQPAVAFVNGLAPGAHVAGAHGWLSFTQWGDYSYHLDTAAAQHLTALQSTLDTFTFTISDGHGGTDTAQLNITIDGQNDNPVAGMDVVHVNEAANTTTASTATGNVLLNDSVAGVSQSLYAVTLDGIALGTSGTATATGLYGDLRLFSDGDFTYSLDNDNAQVDGLNVGDVLYDTFHYKASDGAGHWVTTDISVAVHGVNDAPVATTKMAGTAHEAGAGSGGAPATGDLTFAISDVDDANSQLSMVSVSGIAVTGAGLAVTGSYGQLHVTSHGHYTYDVNDLNITVDALATGESLTDCFEYRVQDAHGAWVTNTIDITIVGQNDAPSVNDVAMSAAEAGITNAGIGASGNILAPAIAFDPEGDLLFVASVDGYSASMDVAGAFGSISVTASGHYHYNVNQAAADFLAAGSSTTDTFTVRVADGHGGSDLANIVITINGANDAPVGGNDTGNAGEVGATTAGYNATGNVLANDSDPDKGNVILVSDVNGSPGGVGAGVNGNYGTLILGANGSYHYVVNDSLPAVNALGPSGSLHDIFSYTVTDSHGGTSTAQLDITIHGANDAPSGGVSISGSALAGDTLSAISTLSDPEGLGPLHYQWQSNGNDISGATGSTFTVTQAEVGTVIGVVVSYVDGGGTTETATASITSTQGQYILGTRSGDSLAGGAGNDTIDGGLGRDTMAGGGGSDLYYVNDPRDLVVESPNQGNDSVVASVSYVLAANVENLTLTGTASTAKGNDLANVITGNARANFITGFGGADTLTGGGGADTFVYTSASDSSATAYDTILDFNAAQKDKIDLRQIDARDNVLQNQAFRWIGTAAFNPDANNAGLLRFDPVTHMLEGSTNADATPEFRILLVGVDHIGTDAGGISMANILL